MAVYDEDLRAAMEAETGSRQQSRQQADQEAVQVVDVAGKVAS
jgi:hypothetical protein